MVYRAMVRSPFDTGCMIFESHAPSVLKKFDKVQTKCLYGLGPFESKCFVLWIEQHISGVFKV